jgi:hypothetical protein
MRLPSPSLRIVIGFGDPLPGKLPLRGKFVLGGKMTESSNASGLTRYWPVLAVVALVAAVFGATSALRGGDTTASAPPAPASTTEGVPPALAAFPGVDPLSAKDCDKSTGRLAVPSLLGPNCVPLWPAGKDNGGATSPQGVTATEITVAVYVPQRTPDGIAALQAAGIPNLPDDEVDALREKVLKTYNDLYETYGRKVKLVRFTASGTNTDDAAAKADAIKVATEIKAFAVLNGPTGTNAFADELFARKVICLCTASQPQESYEKWAPYVWGFNMSSTQGYIHRSDLVKALNGKPAEYGGDAVKGSTRKFGIVYFDTTDGAYGKGVDFFEKRLAESGINLATRISYQFEAAKAAEDSRNIVAKLKSAGVTSVVYAGDPAMPRYLTPEATAQDYFPEWILTGATLTDTAGLGRQVDQAQWRHAFGMSFGPARLDPDFTAQEGNLVSWHIGEELEAYPDLLSIGRFFTGVHLAGPTLSVETYRDALFSFAPTGPFRTSWSISFGTKRWPFPDYNAADDVTLLWWDADATGPNEGGVEGKGMFRYVDGGKRYQPGELPGASFKMFDPAGTSTVLPERPPGDVSPNYPRRKGRE